MQVPPIPDGYHAITPHLTVRGAADAIEFYKKAFDAEEISRHSSPDGTALWHATMRIGDSKFMLNDEFAEMNVLSPLAHGGSAVTLALYVEDADALYRRAVEAGATGTMPPADMFWGDRYAVVIDPFGHKWSISTQREFVTFEEMARRIAAMKK